MAKLVNGLSRRLKRILKNRQMEQMNLRKFSNYSLTFVDLFGCEVDISFSKTVFSKNLLSRRAAASCSTIVRKAVIDGMS